MYPAAKRAHLSKALAGAMLAGDWDPLEATGRVGEALRPRPRWIRALIGEVFDAYDRRPSDRPRELAAFIALMLERRRSAEPPPMVRR